MISILRASFLLCFLVAITIVAAKPQASECNDNEEFDACGSPCAETCDEKPEICILVCQSGCFCKNGYVRKSNEAGSPCISREECRAIEESRCGDNEQFGNCGSYCPPTCDDFTYPLPKPIKPCIDMCKRGCFCKKGYVRASNGKCVKPEGCCTGRNEKFNECGAACVETCDQKPGFCTEQCVTGCFCNSSEYVRASNGTCIARNQCSK